jgi:CheY-like chemotaxis protein
MTRAAMDGGETVKRLLTFSRGGVEGPAERVELGALLRDVAQLTAPRWRDLPQAEGRPISLDLDADTDLYVTGWPHALREAFTNLIFNAVDALPCGGEITLRAHREHGRVTAEVGDTGTGMSPEVTKRLFEPFFTTKASKGTGLGLAGVFGIVERHGGTINVESRVDNGTTFRLSLPVWTSPQVSEESHTGPKDEPHFDRLRILAVDDEPELRRMVKRILTNAGYDILLAGTGEEALELLEAEAGRVDVLLTDVGLGSGMNGWELVSHARTRYPGIRTLLATGWGADIDPARAKEHGVEAVVSKPNRVADLQRLLSRQAQLS